MKMLLSCTKQPPYLVYGCTNKYTMSYGYDITYSEEIKNNLDCLNGKVIGECDFEIEEIKSYRSYTCDDDYNDHYETATLCYDDLLMRSCLNNQQLDNYLCTDIGYVIYIKNLEVFDEPKELDDYYIVDGIYKDINNYKPIKKAPRNIMHCYEYIEEWLYNDGIGVFLNRLFENKILIPVHPEELCRIINGEQDIIIKKKILKEMLKND